MNQGAKLLINVANEGNNNGLRWSNMLAAV